jgi:hypothetical protein
MTIERPSSHKVAPLMQVVVASWPSPLPGHEMLKPGAA